MISDITKSQLEKLTIDANRPLIICDVDEVVVHFIRDFETFIAAKGLFLVPGDPNQPYEVRQKSTTQPLSTDNVFQLVNDYFIERTRNMIAIAGAVEGLKSFANRACVVMLTNLPHYAGDDRRANLAEFGLNYTVITNSGPKGPAIANLAARTTHPVVFIDDSSSYLQSAYDHAPHLEFVHFLHDERFAKHAPNLEFANFRTDNWTDVETHISRLLKA